MESNSRILIMSIQLILKKIINLISIITIRRDKPVN